MKKTDHTKEHEMIGTRIAYFRRIKKLTQKKVAEKLDIDESHLSRIEHATIGISIDMLLNIADVLDVPAWKFFDFSDMEE